MAQEYAVIAIRLPFALHERLKAAIDKEKQTLPFGVDLSVNGAVRQAIHEYNDRILGKSPDAARHVRGPQLELAGVKRRAAKKGSRK